MEGHVEGGGRQDERSWRRRKGWEGGRRKEKEGTDGREEDEGYRRMKEGGGRQGGLETGTVTRTPQQSRQCQLAI